MKNKPFGAIIADARHDIGMTQRELIRHIETLLTKDGRRVIGLSYLSKLENNRMTPPSMPVIKAMAKALRLNEDDLLAAAGRAPADIGTLLMKSEGARRFFRAAVKTNISEQRWEQLHVLIAGPDHIERP